MGVLGITRNSISVLMPAFRLLLLVVLIGGDMVKNAIMAMQATVILRRVLTRMRGSSSVSSSACVISGAVRIMAGGTDWLVPMVSAGVVMLLTVARGAISNELSPYSSGERIPASQGSNSYLPYSLRVMVPRSYNS